MNTELLAFCVRGILRRWKQMLRVSVAVMVSFTFVMGMLLFQENIGQWQIALAKKHFGDWFVMYRSPHDYENEEIRNHPYLDRARRAAIVKSIEDADGITELHIGAMSEGFIRMGNITVEQGHMPQRDDEVAIDWNTLLRLGQGTTIGSEIILDNNTYELAGIMTSYTNVWKDGNQFPGIIVTDTEADRIMQGEKEYIYCYPLKNYIDEDDYGHIFDRISEDSGIKFKLTYNGNVYDNKLWGSTFINNYMYILVMLIGAVAVTYQLLRYNNSRKNIWIIHKNLGAEKRQLIIMSLSENAFILIISFLSGVFLALGLGKLICTVIGQIKGVSFFSAGRDTFIKALFTLAISITICVIIRIFSSLVYIGKPECNNRTLTGVKRISFQRSKPVTEKEFISETSRRFMRSNGLLQNIFIRLFAFMMAVITVICTITVTKVYMLYMNSNKDYDLVGYKAEDEGMAYIMYYQHDYKTVYNDNGAYVRNDKIYNPNDNCRENFDERSGLFEYRFNRDIRYGDSCIYKGISPDIINNIKNIDGVKDISFGYFESGRVFTWTDMDMDKLDVDIMQGQSDSANDRNKKYLFASEYVEPSKKIFDILNEYAEGELDYEKFQLGEEVVVFEDVSNAGVYAGAMQDGVTLNLRNYTPFDTGIRTISRDTHICESEYSKAYNKFYIELMNCDTDSYDYSSNKSSNIYYGSTNFHNINLMQQAEAKFFFDRLSDEQLMELIDRYIEKVIKEAEQSGKNYYYVNKCYFDYRDGKITREELYNLETGLYDEKLMSFLHSEYAFDFYLSPSASAKVVKVVRVTDEVRDRLKNYVPQFGQFTVVASKELVRKAIDRQNEIVKNYFLLDELPDCLTLKVIPNQINVTYDLKAVYSATDNIVSSYLNEAGFSFTSYAEDKAQIRNSALEALVLYGGSGIAAICMYLVMSSIVVKSRMERYRSRLKLLSDTGADKKVLMRIVLKECIRESLWFVLLLPVNMLVCYVIARKCVDKL